MPAAPKVLAAAIRRRKELARRLTDRPIDDDTLPDPVDVSLWKLACERVQELQRKSATK